MPLVFIFTLLSIENVVMVLTPFLLGLAIDGLLSGNFTPVFWLGSLLVSGIVVGTGRRFFDTRCYGSIYAKLASENAVNGWNKGQSVSSLSARSEQIHEMVSFVEVELTQSYNAVIKIAGALLMLSIVDLYLLVGCLISAGIIGLIYIISHKRIFRLNRGLNDQHEKQVLTLEKRNALKMQCHFKCMTRWSIRLSDLEARNFALIDLVAIALVLGSLWVAASGGQATPGSIFAILAYVLEFVEGSYLLPLAFQQFVRLNEITSRLTISPSRSEETLDELPS
ncbi:hypothetical protein PsAD2_01814 [Pseudovibrio axinellae]|uniref:ABC transmembrane type-1 domain-containing protein n=2 Tax=Pseudovibrio axinellae TaxID=989403 RepID=A0A165Z5V7_9HYPH|nr:hypothetical protein PsAD2_01814 [Pseudovibrio axinellae]SEQ30967.1 ABC transporter transmembrane region [Pseudovibrio axinellae]